LCLGIKLKPELKTRLGEVRRLALKSELVSVVIPTIHQTNMVEECVQSLRGHTDWENFEVIIVDDGSNTSTQTSLQQIATRNECRLILKPTNTGFASAVNTGVRESKGRYICLVNNDVTFIESDWLRNLVRTIMQSNCGVAGARLLYPDGRIQHGGVYYMAQSHVFDHRYRYLPANYGPALATQEVLAVTGALMLIRQEVWHQMEGMSEEFFIALEDVDFCLRVHKRGWRVMYCGKAAAIHAEGATRGTTPQNKDPEWYKLELEGYAQFRRKWFGPGGRPRFRIL
jgi:GT2 family glycosyltransferase